MRDIDGGDERGWELMGVMGRLGDLGVMGILGGLGRFGRMGRIKKTLRDMGGGKAGVYREALYMSGGVSRGDRLLLRGRN